MANTKTTKKTTTTAKASAAKTTAKKVEEVVETAPVEVGEFELEGVPAAELVVEEPVEEVQVTEESVGTEEPCEIVEPEEPAAPEVETPEEDSHTEDKAEYVAPEAEVLDNVNPEEVLEGKDDVDELEGELVTEAVVPEAVVPEAVVPETMATLAAEDQKRMNNAPDVRKAEKSFAAPVYKGDVRVAKKLF